MLAQNTTSPRAPLPSVLPLPSAPSTDARPLPRKLGRYTLFDHIGRGGMADIYLAKADTGLGASRLVVIKEVLPVLAGNPELSEMLVSEAKLAAQLDHASIAKVEDLGREDGTLYLAMEYVEGLDLREVLRRAAKRRIAIPVEFSLHVVTEVARALSFAHRARDAEGKLLGIVHRDVSPSNVLLSFDGEVKLCDFGIARATALDAFDTDEAIRGKAGYMSPEQARGEVLDGRADVFSVGVILWELYAGRRLYKTEGDERLLDVARRAEIPPLPKRDLPHEDKLFAIVERALGAFREDRYATASALLEDLEEYAAMARLVASPIVFGEWLTEHFGAEVTSLRRARARVVEALAKGPAVILQPILEEKTPSEFPVALRAGDDVVSPPPSRAARAKAVKKALRRMDAPAKKTLSKRPEKKSRHAFFAALALLAAAIAVIGWLAHLGS